MDIKFVKIHKKVYESQYKHWAKISIRKLFQASIV